MLFSSVDCTVNPDKHPHFRSSSKKTFDEWEKSEPREKNTYFLETLLKNTRKEHALIIEKMIFEAKSKGANYLAIAKSIKFNDDFPYSITFKFRPLATIEKPTRGQIEHFSNGDSVEIFDLNSNKQN